MKIKFWGVRGSIPTPGQTTLKYGGNTACLEIRNDNNDILILDAGTGIRGLGLALMGEFKGSAMEMMICLSHVHWDHIQGLPFFVPIYIPTSKISLVAPLGTHRTLQEVMNIQMDHDFFPLNFDGLPSKVSYTQILEESFEYKNYKISTILLNHGGLGGVLGYKITADNKTVTYASDHEGYEIFFSVNSMKTQKIVDNMEGKYRKFLSGSDLLIHDAQYDAEEYPKKKGWGHSSFDYAVNTTLATNIKKVCFIHYDPLYSDQRLDAIISKKKQSIIDEGITDVEIFGSMEGTEIVL